MKSSTTLPRIILLAAVALAAAGGGYWFGSNHGSVTAAEDKKVDDSASTQPSEEDKPVVPVVTSPLVVLHISETLTAYGTVVAEAGDVHVVSVPFESRIIRARVTPGEQVAPNTPLVELEASPDALIALEEAKNVVGVSARDLKQVEERLAQHLATNVELSQAQQAAQSAKLKFDSLAKRGVGEKRELKADFAAIVSKVDVQEGQIVPVGGPLVELAAGNRIEVRLNVEPADARSLEVGATVQLKPVDGAKTDKPTEGKVRMISQRVDPSTRLVEVRVSLPAEARLMLDSFVNGELQGATADGFVVPRDAALPNDDGTYSIFSVKDRRAVQHAVRIGLQHEDVVQVLGDDLHAGDAIVVSGNYLLKDGMDVEMESPSTQPTTEPREKKLEAKE